MNSIDVIGHGLCSGRMEERQIVELATEILAPVTDRAVGAFFVDRSRVCCGCTLDFQADDTDEAWILHVWEQGGRAEAETAILVNYMDGRATIEGSIQIDTFQGLPTPVRE